MQPFIILTFGESDARLWVRADDISAMNKTDAGTMVYIQGNEEPFIVNETPEQIFSFIKTFV